MLAANNNTVGRQLTTTLKAMCTADHPCAPAWPGRQHAPSPEPTPVSSPPVSSTNREAAKGGIRERILEAAKTVYLNEDTPKTIYSPKKNEDDILAEVDEKASSPPPSVSSKTHYYPPKPPSPPQSPPASVKHGVQHPASDLTKLKEGERPTVIGTTPPPTVRPPLN